MVWHILTGDFPPRCGGVGDYTANLAQALGAAGDRVHVWAPGAAANTNGAVTVEPLPDVFGPRARAELADAFRRDPGTILLQYVPNALGRRGANLAFCYWLRQLSRQGADVRVMFHEPYFYYSLSRPWRNGLAVIQRRMASALLRSARRVYFSTETWRRYLAAPVFEALPIPSSLHAAPDPGAIAAVRRRLSVGGRPIVGHFGTYGEHVANLLEAWLPAIARSLPSVDLVLLGAGSDAFLMRQHAQDPALAARASASGRLDDAQLAAALAACDVLVQPYPDGITTRRTSVMAGLRLGVATVSTLGDLTEPVWRETGAVRLVAPRDAAAAAAAVAALIGDPPARRALGASGRAAYEAHFSMEHTVARLRAAAAAA